MASPKRSGQKRAPKLPAPGEQEALLVPTTEVHDSVMAHPGEAPAKPAFWHYGENLLLTFFFATMMVLPLLDIVSRKLHAYFNFVPVSPIPGSLALVQHSTLAIMMFGGAIAAREGKLLQLATTASMIPDRYKTIVRVITTALGAAITAYLVKASYQFSMIEQGVGDIIAIGIPKWLILFFLPVGFSMILARMIWRVSEKNSLRLLTLAVAVGLASLGPIIHGPSETFIYICFGLLMVAVVLGMPVFLVLGGAALIFLWNSDTPIDSIPAETYRMVVSPTIPTIPLFTLTGYFLAEGGASQRLLRVFQAVFGLMRGGPAIVTALVCAFFTAFTGGSGVTILALGGLLMPILIAEKYKERDALGLLTSAGSLGMLFPPSLPVILYGVVSHTPIDQLFMGGLLPGILLLLLTAWWGVAKSGKKSSAQIRPWWIVLLAWLAIGIIISLWGLVGWFILKWGGIYYLCAYLLLSYLWCMIKSLIFKIWAGIGLALVLFVGTILALWKLISGLTGALLTSVAAANPFLNTPVVSAFVFLLDAVLVFVLVRWLFHFMKKVVHWVMTKLGVEKFGMEALRSGWESKWELLLPLVVFFFLFVIKVTLVESAALTALYAFVVEIFIYGHFGQKKIANVTTLAIKDVPKVVTECGILVGGVLLILGVSLGFTNDMVDAQVPARLASWVHDSVHSQWLFLLIVNFMLIIVGSLLEIFAAIVVVVPLLMPMANAFGVDPVHMGIIFLANMELGFIAPPLGLNLFLSSYRFKKPMTEIYMAIWPMYLILHAMVFAITYIPFLTTWLPSLFNH